MKRQRGKEVRGKKWEKDRFPLVIFFSCVLFLCFFCGGCPAQQQDQVCFKRECINVEVVQTRKEMLRGLQFRDYLLPDAGMLFIFEKSLRHGFWMKDTHIPLDIIWLDNTQKIVHIEHNVPPCTVDPCRQYTPGVDALYVLEVNAGYAQKHQLSLGLVAEFKKSPGHQVTKSQEESF